MKIVIAGAGSVGRFVALELLDHGHEVTLIDHNPDQMRVATVADADWVLADACSPDVLADAGVRETDVLVAATGDDKANLVISLLAKTEFGVPRVVARINHPRNEWLFNEAWGVDVPVSTPRIMTALVEEAVSEGAPIPLFTFNKANVAMYAIVLPEDSPLVGERIGQVDFPAGTVLAALLRDQIPVNPQPDDVFESGDELLMLVPEKRGKHLEHLGTLVNGVVPETGQADAPTTTA